MNRRLAAPAVATVCLVLLSVAPSALAAQLSAQTFPVIPVRATTASGGFRGVFGLSSFRLRRAGVVAVGRLTGTLKDRRYPRTQGIDVSGAAFPVTAAPVANAPDCARLALRFAANGVTLFGLRAHFPSGTLVLRPRPGMPAAYRELLCGTSQAAAAHASQSAMVHLLNAIRLMFH